MPLLNADKHNNANAFSHHPWERRIKYVYTDKMKYAHNSINNPVFPVKKTKKFDNNRFHFTVIGNRVTKEFLYCINLLKGLHKYRSKNFEAPIIRGVTSVEWPHVWNDLKLRFGGLTHCLESQCAVLLNDNFLGGENELKALIESKYRYHVYLNYYQESISQFVNFINSSSRPCAYMHFSINEEHIGTMIFMLYADLLPYTCENFLRLCKSKKGGYVGTPVHRIVKDGWIQCGGFGLKSTDLACENFIIPHDRRGVLCMANDGRHIDCSTQFFILLKPAPWMAHKYVAFGQLIEGEGTLQKIESVPTWYESPTSEIIIHKAGILNMECQDIVINKGTVDYIKGHIEDLVVLAELFYSEILDKVFLEVEARRVAALQMKEGVDVSGDEAAAIRTTQRFIQKKEDIEKQLQKSHVEEHPLISQSSPTHNNENNDFDVEAYGYESEEYSPPYPHVSFEANASPVPKPNRPYYLPLTDVPYPGEIDSTHDLRKFLRGDYCLESDLKKNTPKKAVNSPSFASELFKLDDEESDIDSDESLESFEEREIRRYLKLNVDRVSFAGEIVRGIAKGIGKLNIFDETRKSELITDDELRKFRLASVDYRTRDKTVSLSVPDTVKAHKKIKRRQTGYVRPQDLERAIRSTTMLNEEDDSATAITRKVRIAPTAIGSSLASRTLPTRRPTGFVRAPQICDSDTEVKRQSVLTRLYDDMTHDDTLVGPTLKDYKPMSETRHKNLLLLTCSPNLHIKNEENSRERYLRHSATIEGESYEHVLNLQHGKKVARKISSDYVNTIDQMEQKLENSIRSIEFARTRPAISVTDYQMKNKKYSTRRSSNSQVKTVMRPKPDFGKQHSSGGLRLPGDTPLYSSEEDEQKA